MYVSEWREKKINQRDSLSVWSDSSCQTPVKSRHCFLSSVPPANFPAKVIRCSEWRKRLRNKQHIGIINFHEEMATGYDSQCTTCRCAQGILAAKHKEKGESSTQKTPHVLVEKQEKLRHTCYSAPNSNITDLWMTLLCSMM